MCIAIRKLYKKDFIPIIMVSAKGDPSDVTMGLDCGANDYVKKPFNRSVLRGSCPSSVSIATPPSLCLPP